MSSQSPEEAVRKRSSVATDTELRRQLMSCMAETLTSRQYQVFVLNCLEGMPQKEIAAEFGLSRTAVSKTLAAAKYRMRLALGYTFEQEESQDLLI